MNTNARRYLAGTYLVFCIVVIAIERHGLGRGPMSAMDKILVAPFLWGVAACGVRDGSVLGRFSRVERSQSPITFWFLVAFAFLFGIVLFFWGVHDALP